MLKSQKAETSIIIETTPVANIHMYVWKKIATKNKCQIQKTIQLYMYVHMYEHISSVFLCPYIHT